MNQQEVNNITSPEKQENSNSIDVPDQTVPVVEVQSSPERNNIPPNSIPTSSPIPVQQQRTPTQSPLQTIAKSSEERTPLQSPISPGVQTSIPSAPSSTPPTAIPAEDPNSSGLNLPSVASIAPPKVAETISSLSSWGSSLFSSFTQKSKEIAKKLETDVKVTEKEFKKTFEEEPKKFEKQQIEVIKRLPWDNPRLGILQEECKEMIIKLSEKESTFFDFPPDGEYKEFNLQQMEYLAPKLCEIDKNLAKMSVKLIRRTKLKEYDFWRNYFYHVYGIERSYLEKAERWLGKSNNNSNNSNKLPSPLPDISNTATTTAAAGNNIVTPVKSPSPIVDNNNNITTATTATTIVTPSQTSNINNTLVNTTTTTVPISLSTQQQPIQQNQAQTTTTTTKTATPIDPDTNPSTASTNTDDLDISALAAQLTFEDEIMPDDDEIENLIRDELS